MRFETDGRALIFRKDGETLRIEAWGRDALRVRAVVWDKFSGERWALTETPEDGEPEVRLAAEELREENRTVSHEFGEIRNGKIRAKVNDEGVITFLRGEKVLLQEYYRFYGGTLSRESRCLKIVNREWKGIPGSDLHSLRVKFESDPDEKIFGMGQYQQERMDLKGCILERAQRNSQVSVPFALSSVGYGFLWNSPSVGETVFGMNCTEWKSDCIREMDYWITAGDSPKEIIRNYTAVTGRPGEFPEDRMGLWQCKLRYRTQEEVLSVARKYRELGIPLDQIVIDFFHWTVQGDWKFDTKYWPDVKAMTDELHAMGTKVIVSVWPTVDRRSENFSEMTERGLLVKTERGAMQTYDFQGDCVSVDAFSQETRNFVWEKCREHYLALGIDGFWLDNCEPDLGVYDFDHYRYSAGPALLVSCMYPQMFSRIFDDPMREKGMQFVNLIRCGWAGSQKLNNVIWSGDVPSTFESLRDQLAAGLNMGLAGISWWTTDIGGFMTDDVDDPDFRELLIRWYQFATFSPVLRMHGDRGPHDIPALDDRDFGGGYLNTGRPNELWSYGEENFRIMKKFLDIRLGMHDYIRELYGEASENGSPLIRAMFYEFPEDRECWKIRDQYMFGSRFLCAPVLELGARERSVYLPAGTWRLTSTDEVFEGGRRITAPAPLDAMPVFERA